MKIQDIVEAKGFDEKAKAYEELKSIYERVTKKKFTATPEEAKQVLARASKLLKIAGSKFTTEYKGLGAGHLYDVIYRKLDEILSKHGERVFPSAINVKDFAKGIAAYYHGNLTWNNPTKWVGSGGWSRKDPEWKVVFKGEDIDDVWQDLLTRGKKVYISDKMSKTPITYLQFGNVLVGKDASIRGVFSDNPQRTDFLYFQSTKILKNWYRTKHDITPQEANALQDIAKTKNQDAIEKIKAMLDVLQARSTKEVLAKIVDSGTIEPAFKQTLTNIIKGAKDFKEPQ